mmetsp:Transcript_7316/g.10487  ORF Transcript_7316/g.10487 Transcript_7316/m.10487 type:complete len:82 (+) Transcript_7316:184-429(+)
MIGVGGGASFGILLVDDNYVVDMKNDDCLKESYKQTPPAFLVAARFEQQYYLDPRTNWCYYAAITMTLMRKSRGCDDSDFC